MKPKQVLDRLKWVENKLDRATIVILHRGVPGNTRSISGSDILSTDKSFMYIRSGKKTVAIPYHRVLKIEVEGKTVWKKPT